MRQNEWIRFHALQGLTNSRINHGKIFKYNKTKIPQKEDYQSMDLINTK